MIREWLDAIAGTAQPAGCINDSPRLRHPHFAVYDEPDRQDCHRAG